MRVLCGALGLLVASAVIPQAQASTIVALDEAELSRHADAVVFGTIINTRVVVNAKRPARVRWLMFQRPTVPSLAHHAKRHAICLCNPDDDA